MLSVLPAISMNASLFACSRKRSCNSHFLHKQPGFQINRWKNPPIWDIISAKNNSSCPRVESALIGRITITSLLNHFPGLTQSLTVTRLLNRFVSSFFTVRVECDYRKTKPYSLGDRQSFAGMWWEFTEEMLRWSHSARFEQFYEFHFSGRIARQFTFLTRYFIWCWRFIGWIEFRSFCICKESTCC
jgi:hypothetical protein